VTPPTELSGETVHLGLNRRRINADQDLLACLRVDAIDADVTSGGSVPRLASLAVS
jgi:hypothetical protein